MQLLKNNANSDFCRFYRKKSKQHPKVGQLKCKKDSIIIEMKQI